MSCACPEFLVLELMQARPHLLFGYAVCLASGYFNLVAALALKRTSLPLVSSRWEELKSDHSSVIA
jgi:hypothetical protein